MPVILRYGDHSPTCTRLMVSLESTILREGDGIMQMRAEVGRKGVLSGAIALLLAFALGGCAAPAAQEPEKDKGEGVDWEIVREAYVYALPLLMMDATAVTSTNTEKATDLKAPVNQLIHSSHLADASSKSVVTPNVDTIYSQIWVDLSDDALVFHKPASDRFLSIEVLDYYTNSAAILGTGGDTQEACTYVLVGPDWKDPLPEGLVRIDLPTNGAWLIVRTLIEGEEDMVNVQALQQQMEAVPLKSYITSEFTYEPPKGAYSAGNDFIPVERVLAMGPQEFFSQANELMLANPPVAADGEIVERMAEIGVGPGFEFDGSILGDDAGERWADMLAGFDDELVTESLQFMVASGSWQFFGEPIAEFGSEYAFRALVALEGFGANPVSVAIYPKAETEDSGAVLTGGQSYIIHFDEGQLPPVEEYGFWSITAYGEDDFLIDNEIDRYLINDRSDLVFNEDGSLDILVQADMPEDTGKLGNWLPVGKDRFHLYLRIYLPAEQALSGAWQPPTITAI